MCTFSVCHLVSYVSYVSIFIFFVKEKPESTSMVNLCDCINDYYLCVFSVEFTVH